MRRYRPASRDHLVHSDPYSLSYDVDIRGVVVIAGDPEVELPVIRQDCNADANLDPNGNVGVGAQHAPARRIERELRARDVGSDGIDVVLRGPCHYVRTNSGESRRYEPGQFHQSLSGLSLFP